MTFCLGIKVEDGLIGIADTRITSGTERITAQKVTIHQHGDHSLFLMTSGLRSVRDKALTYFEGVLKKSEGYDHLYEVVNAFAEQVRRVEKEDKAAITESGLQFNLYSLVGGQFKEDSEHKLYMIYPQGNWVEVSKGTPFYIIGESGYGKPILERVLRSSSDLTTALQTGFLAFNATITCAVDVDYPIDVVVYPKDTYKIVSERYTKDEVSGVSKIWQDYLQAGVKQLPKEWLQKIMSKIPSTP